MTAPYPLLPARPVAFPPQPGRDPLRARALMKTGTLAASLSAGPSSPADAVLVSPGDRHAVMHACEKGVSERACSAGLAPPSDRPSCPFPPFHPFPDRRPVELYGGDDCCARGGCAHVNGAKVSNTSDAAPRPAAAGL